MTTEEKLKHFHEASISSAYEKGSTAIFEYKQILEEKFEEHKAYMLKKTENDLKRETDNIIRENNDKYSKAHNHIKMELTRKEQEVTDGIFDELIKMFHDFKKNNDYKKLLICQINDVRTYARWGDEQVIYIDPSDEAFIDELEEQTNCTLTISEHPFIGGIKAVVNKNVLIDNSLLTKIEELKESFNLEKYIEMNAIVKT